MLIEGVLFARSHAKGFTCIVLFNSYNHHWSWDYYYSHLSNEEIDDLETSSNLSHFLQLVSCGFGTWTHVHWFQNAHITTILVTNWPPFLSVATFYHLFSLTSGPKSQGPRERWECLPSCLYKFFCIGPLSAKTSPESFIFWPQWTISNYYTGSLTYLEETHMNSLNIQLWSMGLNMLVLESQYWIQNLTHDYLLCERQVT